MVKPIYCAIVTLIAIQLTISKQASAQAAMGVYSAEQTAALASGDPTFTDMRYYKNLTYELKKGEAAMFYMRAVAYMPQIYTVDRALANWGTGLTTSSADGNNTSMIVVIADKDTIFDVVFTSSSPSMSGDFVYGIRKMDSAQMVYPPESDFCGRLTYIINHWQCLWTLAPNGYTGYSSYTYMPNGIINNQSLYLDSFFDASEELLNTDNSATALRYFESVVQQVTACLDMTLWEIKREDYVSDLDGTIISTTYFNLKGLTSQSFLNSIGITLQDEPGGTKTVEITFY